MPDSIATGMYARAAAMRAAGLSADAEAEERDALLVKRLERTLDEITRDSFEQMEAMDAQLRAGQIAAIRTGH